MRVTQAALQPHREKPGAPPEGAHGERDLFDVPQWGTQHRAAPLDFRRYAGTWMEATACKLALKTRPARG